MNNLLRTGASCLAAIALSGCSSLMNDSYETIRLAVSGPAPLVTTEYINTLKQPALVARLVQSEALLVRVAANQGVAEWHGLEQMLVTHNGRVIQAAGLPSDSDVLAPLAADDPFRGDLRSLGQAEVVRAVDYPDRFLTGIPQIATYKSGPLETMQVMGVDRQLRRLDEKVRMPALGFSATNSYWFEPATGRVIVSVQHLAPGLPPLWLTEVSPTGVQP